MKNIETLIEDDGNITVGKLDEIDSAASAAEGHNMLALLAKR